jgi:hypothetical protein
MNHSAAGSERISRYDGREVENTHSVIKSEVSTYSAKGKHIHNFLGASRAVGRTADIYIMQTSAFLHEMGDQPAFNDGEAVVDVALAAG